MYDINAIMFFEVKFEISLNDFCNDLLWNIVLHIRNWITYKCKKRCIQLDSDLRKWTSIKFGGRISSKTNIGESVFIESEYFKDENNELEFWACRIVEKYQPRTGYSSRRWITEIGYEQTGSRKAIFSCVVSFSDTPGYIGEYEKIPELTIPKVVREIISDENISCKCGQDFLSLQAQKLNLGEWPIFWERLKNPKRELPYIYISPIKEISGNNENYLLINPEHLAEKLCGNALVFYSENPEFSDEMKRSCANGYACYNGSVRIYFPDININEKGNSYKHRYLSSVFIRDRDEETVINIFSKALVQNVSFYETFFCIDECKRKKAEIERRKRLEVIHEQYEERLNQIQEETLAEAIEIEKDKLMAEEKNERLQDEISNLKQDKYNLEVQLENLRSIANKSKESDKITNGRYEIKTMSGNPVDVIRYFSVMLQDKIYFTDEAFKSAKTCELSIDELWKALYNLANCMRDLYIKKIPSPDKEFKMQTGIECARSEGSMTRKNNNLMKQFIVCYDNDEVDIQPHLKFKAKKQSIHFGYHEDSQKIIVGHCGKHMDIHSTQSVK